MAFMSQYSLFLDFSGQEWYELHRKDHIKTYYDRNPEKLEGIKRVSLTGDVWAREEYEYAIGEAQVRDQKARSRQIETLYSEIKKAM